MLIILYSFYYQRNRFAGDKRQSLRSLSCNIVLLIGAPQIGNQMILNTNPGKQKHVNSPYF